MNKSIGYAIAAIAQLAAHDGERALSSSVMSERTGTPNRYLLQETKSLFNAWLVTSVRGIHGGYRLAKPAN